MTGKKPHDAEIDDDPYDKESVERMLEDDQLEPKEAGFMEGYQEPNLLKCPHCGKAVDPEHPYEVEELEGDYLFCSEECGKKFNLRKDIPKQDELE